MKKTLCLVIILISITAAVHAQKIAIKTNLLYGAYTSTPNLALEFIIGKKSTLDISGGYNPWNLDGEGKTNKKLVHWLGNVEYRRWLCQPFSGHFFGVHALGTQYNISNHKLPLIFGANSDKYRFEGYGIGAGISYGYHWILGKHWSLEGQIGFGYARLNYDKYDCKSCGKKLDKIGRNYFGPTKAGISLIYIIK